MIAFTPKKLMTQCSVEGDRRIKVLNRQTVAIEFAKERI